MICLSCHGPNDLTLGYVSRESSLIIEQLELIKLFNTNAIGSKMLELTPFLLLFVETGFTVRM